MRHKILAVIAAVALTLGLAGVLGNSTPAHATTYGQIELGTTGQCLDNRGNSNNNGNPIQDWTCLGNENQAWAIVQNGVVNEIQNENGKCLDDPSDSGTNGTKLQLYTCLGNNNQDWTPVPVGNGYVYTNANQIIAIDANGTHTNGTQVQAWAYNQDANQQWGLANGNPNHYNNFIPSAQCPDGSGSGCATNPDTFPLSASYCSNAINGYSSERIPANATADATKGPSTVSAANYGPWTDNSGEPQMERDIQAASGQFTGNTDTILQWAACSEGWNERIAEAEAYVESSGQQSEVGDSGCSYGILQVRVANTSCPSSNNGWGGYPDVQNSTAFDAEMQMSYLRACYDGSIDYLYPSGQTVSSMAASNGWAYIFWGCIGSWFSGDWYSSAAQGYISQVQSAYNNQSWFGL